jgi:hypothetical protein
MRLLAAIHQPDATRRILDEFFISNPKAEIAELNARV